MKKTPRYAPADASVVAPDLESTVRTDEDLEIRVWLRLLVCVGLMEQEIRARLRTTFGITIARFEILAQLYRVDTGLGMKELSDRLMVSKGNVTGLIVRMEDAGLIERRRDPVDGRAQTVSLTPKGRKLFDKVRPLHNEWFRELMHGFPRRDMKQLNDLLKGLKVSLSRK
jgi:DNA-binding MarR family transcriptional regulator